MTQDMFEIHTGGEGRNEVHITIKITFSLVGKGIKQTYKS